MNTALTLAAICAALAVPAMAQDAVAPVDVSFSEYGEIEQSLTGQAGDVAKGREIVADKGQGNCIACHMITDLQDVPFHGEVGPSLDGAGDRWSEAQLRGVIVNAKKTFPGTIMPAFYHTGPYERPGNAFTGKAAEGELPPLLSAQDVEDVVAYLATLDTYYE